MSVCILSPGTVHILAFMRDTGTAQTQTTIKTYPKMRQISLTNSSMDDLCAGITQDVCEVRAAARHKESWGEPLAVLQVVVVRHGPAWVTATELLQREGGMHGAVELQASWDVQIPAHLVGIVQLQTSAKINGQGTMLAVWFLLHSYLRIAREVLGQCNNRVSVKVGVVLVKAWCLVCTLNSHMLHVISVACSAALKKYTRLCIVSHAKQGLSCFLLIALFVFLKCPTCLVVTWVSR